MNDREWNPLIGWRDAIVQVLIRSGIAMCLSLLAAAGLHFTITALEREMKMEIWSVEGGLMLPFVLLAGVLEGWLAQRGLMDKTGLEGKALVPLVAGGLIAVQFAGAAIAGALAPNWVQVWFYLFTFCGVVSVAWAVRAILSD